MLSIQGTVFIEFRNSDGKVLRRYSFQNRILHNYWQVYRSIALAGNLTILHLTTTDTNPTWRTAGLKIGLSHRSRPLPWMTQGIDQVIAIGGSPSVGDRFFENFDQSPRNVVIKNTFGFSGTERQFQTVFLCAGNVGTKSDYGGGLLSSIITAVLLPAPLTQAPNETLDIYYRISSASGPYNGPPYAKDLSRIAFYQHLKTGANGNSIQFYWRINRNHNAQCPISLMPPGRIADLRRLELHTVNSDSQRLRFTTADHAMSTTDMYLYARGNLRTGMLARMFSAAWAGSNNNTVLTQALRRDTDTLSFVSSTRFDDVYLDAHPVPLSPTHPTFQPVYSHKWSSTTPFYDATNLAGTSLRPTLGGTYPAAWRGGPGKLAFVFFTAAGDAATCRYKIAIADIISLYQGWGDDPQRRGLGILHSLLPRNTRGRYLYDDGKTEHTPIMEATNRDYHGSGTFPRNTADTVYFYTALSRLNGRHIIFWDETGVDMRDVFTLERVVYDQDSTPALPVTDLRSCIYNHDADHLYCVCHDTGLWRIDLTANTVTQISGESNMVCVAFFNDYGNWYALKSDQNLYLDSDLTTPLSFNADIRANTTTASYLNRTRSIMNQIACSPDGQFVVALWQGKGDLTVNAMNERFMVFWDSTDGRQLMFHGEFAPFGEMALAQRMLWYPDAGTKGFALYRLNYASGWRKYVTQYVNLADFTAQPIRPGGADRRGWGITDPIRKRAGVLDRDGTMWRRWLDINDAGALRAAGNGYMASDPFSLPLPATPSVLYLGKGLAFSNSSIFHIEDFWCNMNPANPNESNEADALETSIKPNSENCMPNPLRCDIYGWNGSAWVLEDWQIDRTAPKLINTTPGTDGKAIPDLSGGPVTETVVDGLTITWEQLTPATPRDVVQGNYFTQGMIDNGILVNNLQASHVTHFSSITPFARKTISGVCANAAIGTPAVSRVEIADTTVHQMDDAWGEFDRPLWTTNGLYTVLPSFTSRKDGNETRTGTIKIYSFTVAQALQVTLAGGGLTRGYLKTLRLVRQSDDQVLQEWSYQDIMGEDNDGRSKSYPTVYLGTAAHAGEVCYLELEDEDTTTGNGWMAIGKAIYVIDGWNVIPECPFAPSPDPKFWLVPSEALNTMNGTIDGVRAAIVNGTPNPGEIQFWNGTINHHPDDTGKPYTLNYGYLQRS
ncbi:MAG: hypothetical protein AAGF24_00065 [Cyanobacteria bacterium P01_H01_bin.121]